MAAVKSSFHFIFDCDKLWITWVKYVKSGTEVIINKPTSFVLNIVYMSTDKGIAMERIVNKWDISTNSLCTVCKSTVANTDMALCEMIKYQVNLRHRIHIYGISSSQNEVLPLLLLLLIIVIIYLSTLTLAQIMYSWVTMTKLRTWKEHVWKLTWGSIT
jgi:hypothetical protein